MPRAAAVPEADTPPDDDRALFKQGDRVMLIVDDDGRRANAVMDLVHRAGLKAVIAARPEWAVALARAYRPRGIVLAPGAASGEGGVPLDRLLCIDPGARNVPLHVLWAPGNDPDERVGLRTYVRAPATRESLAAALRRVSEYRGKPVATMLVVARGDDERASLTAALADAKVRTTAARDPRDAAAALVAERPDAVLVDLGLDRGGAEEIGAALRRTASLREVPIVFLTHAPLPPEASDRSIAASLGAADAPSADQALADLALFARRVAESTLTPDDRSVPSGPDESLAGKRVLVVDDDVRNVFAITSMLEHQDMQVRFATNGHDAIASLDKNRDVDGVLMDIMMPGMDGYETIRAIRSDPRFSTLPIIALTAKAMAGDREKCLEAGASDYVTKPVESDQLLAVLRVWLHKSAS
jgi:CheY-like chemotaxis protein